MASYHRQSQTAVICTNGGLYHWTKHLRSPQETINPTVESRPLTKLDDDRLLQLCSIDLRGTSSRPHHPGSYNTPLTSSAQESDVGVECLNGTAAGYLSELCISVASASGRQHLRSASTGLLQVPRTRITIGRRSFAVAKPSLWNSLPAALRRPEMTLHTFKRQLKAYLFHI